VATTYTPDIQARRLSADVERSCDNNAADMKAVTLKLFALSDILKGFGNK
jgi:hypothetical protein